MNMERALEAQRAKHVARCCNRARRHYRVFPSQVRGWNPLLLPDPHPARAQHWVQGYGCFVHKDELEIDSEDFFFNSSNTSTALALASWSCRCPRSYFGRRYRYPLRFINARNRLSLRLMPVSLLDNDDNFALCVLFEDMAHGGCRFVKRVTVVNDGNDYPVFEEFAEAG